MPLIINGHTIPDGGNVEINGVKPKQIIVNGSIVWRDSVAPVFPSDATFNASDDLFGQVKIEFTPASGVPNPSHDLYIVGEDEPVARGISSGYIYNTPAGTQTYYVKACNSAGCADSKTDEGTSLLMEIIIDYDTTTHPQYVTGGVDGDWVFTPPEGYDEFQVCIVGGGGSGANETDNCSTNVYEFIGGGKSGEVVSTNIAPLSDVLIHIGKGGVPNFSTSQGVGGEATTVDNITAQGGIGGYASENQDEVYHKGDGDIRTTCGGSQRDGSLYIKQCGINLPDIYFYGGESSGFGKGGDGYNTPASSDGIYGSGGGAGTQDAVVIVGKGGDGRVIITPI